MIGILSYRGIICPVRTHLSAKDTHKRAFLWTKVDWMQPNNSLEVRQL